METVKENKVAKLSMQKITEEQSAWLAAKSATSGDSIASIVRSLIQAEVNKSKRVRK